jgi:hypothetical protein
MKVIVELPAPWMSSECIEHFKALLSGAGKEIVSEPRVRRSRTEEFTVLLRMLLEKLSIGSLTSIDVGPKGCRICFRVRNFGGMTAIPLLLSNVPIGTAIYRVDWLGRKRERIVISK